MNRTEQTKLILEDGSVFIGDSFGAKQSTAGEVVFNTGMIGYPESLTDPSYQGQILTLTYPLIGNYGVNKKQWESNSIKATALIVSDYSQQHNHWHAKTSLAQWLKNENIPALSGIDTRALTQKLREKGTMLGKIVFNSDRIDFDDPNKRNLVAEVSIKKPKLYKNGRKTIALIDCGAKNNIINSLLKRKVSVLRVPWNYDLFKSNHKFDALFVSNGPGDPKQCHKTIGLLKQAMEYKIPTFGICLGTQLLGLAAGMDTYKLKYGHRSQNQPCLETGSKKCFITSQNHGFALRSKMPRGWNAWFVNANDKTVEGIKHNSLPFMAVQFHPEATPGPVDTGFLFDKFLKVVK